MESSPYQATLAAHEAKIEALDRQHAEMRLDQHYLRKQLDRLQLWIMATLATVLAGIAVQFLRMPR
jgi:hypothetical protein